VSRKIDLYSLENQQAEINANKQAPVFRQV
jgi:hypothetical protein